MDDIILKALSSEEIISELKNLPEWEVAVSDLPGKAPLQRTELRRRYEFTSFENAIDFMCVAAKHIAEADHHPRWENSWRTVTVWLSTWAIGFKPSRLDIDLAHYLDDLYQTYPHPKNKRTAK